MANTLWTLRLVVEKKQNVKGSSSLIAFQPFCIQLALGTVRELRLSSTPAALTLTPDSVQR